jgi:prepilin-type N-terminal cleavage/methylation domain-containing protein
MKGAAGTAVPTRRWSERGLTLLEVMIAVIILSIASALMMATSRISTTGQNRSKIYGDASTATREVLENLRTLTLDSINHLSNSKMPHSQGGSVEVYVTSRSLIAADVDDINALDTTSLRWVTLNTRFKSKAGTWVTKTFSTIVYKP